MHCDSIFEFSLLLNNVEHSKDLRINKNLSGDKLLVFSHHQHDNWQLQLLDIAFMSMDDALEQLRRIKNQWNQWKSKKENSGCNHTHKTQRKTRVRLKLNSGKQQYANYSRQQPRGFINNGLYSSHNRIIICTWFFIWILLHY